MSRVFNIRVEINEEKPEVVEPTPPTQPTESEECRIARALITLHEGKRNKLYRDSVGITTIGIGHNIQDRGLSDAAIDFILCEDMEIARQDAISWLGEDTWTQLDPVRKAAVIDFSMNLGLPKLEQFQTTRALIRQKDYGIAATNMMKSKWASQVGRRAERVTEMIRTGKLPDDVPGLAS